MSIETQSGRKTLSPEEVSSMILVKMKEIAENYLGEEVNTLSLQSPLISTMPKDKQLRMLVLFLA